MHPSRETPIQRVLKVGKATVGLVGYDIALSEALTRKLPPEEAAEWIYSKIEKGNYVPPGFETEYKKAIQEEYVRLSEGGDGGRGGLTIRILGPGCVSCNRIYTMSIEILQRLGIAADIESIQELDEVWRHGVTTTPALIINGEVKSSGRLPTPAEIEMWIREAAE